MNKYLSEKIKNLNLILIFLIVLLHSYNITETHENNYLKIIEDFFTNGITRIAVPLFFLLSGYLFFINFEFTFKGYIYKIKKRIVSLAIPFLIWSSIFIIIVYLIGLLNFRIPAFEIKNLTDILNFLFIHPIPFQLWFIRDLFLISLISPLIYILVKHLWFVFIPLLLFIWFPNNQIFVIFDNETILFFSIGAFIAIHAQKIALQVNSNRWFFLIIAICWIFCIVSKQILMNQFSQYLFRLAELFGIATFWMGYDLLNKENRVFTYFMKFNSYSFIIFLMHEPLLTFAKKLFFVFSKTDILLLLFYFSAPALIILLIIEFAKKIKTNHNLYSIITGSRNL